MLGCRLCWLIGAWDNGKTNILVVGSTGRVGQALLAALANKLMQAAESAGAKRFVQLSSIFALQSEKWVGPGFEALKDYYIAKHFADLYLTTTAQLDYTIFQLSSLRKAAD